MNETDGVVVRIEGDHAWVRPQREASACGGCPQRGGCGVNSADEETLPLLCLPNSIRASTGDAVVIQAGGGVLLRAVWVVYGIPLLLSLAGATVGLHMLDSEAGAVVGMLVGLVGGFVLRLRQKVSCDAVPALSLSFKYPSKFQ